MEKAARQVVLINEVRGDCPFSLDIVAEPGVYDAYVNPHGAVAVKASNGEFLGVKPREFEWLENPK